MFGFLNYFRSATSVPVESEIKIEISPPDVSDMHEIKVELDNLSMTEDSKEEVSTKDVEVDAKTKFLSQSETERLESFKKIFADKNFYSKQMTIDAINSGMKKFPDMHGVYLRSAAACALLDYINSPIILHNMATHKKLYETIKLKIKEFQNDTHLDFKDNFDKHAILMDSLLADEGISVSDQEKIESFAAIFEDKTFHSIAETGSKIMLGIERLKIETVQEENHYLKSALFAILFDYYTSPEIICNFTCKNPKLYKVTMSKILEFQNTAHADFKQKFEQYEILMAPYADLCMSKDLC